MNASRYADAAPAAGGRPWSLASLIDAGLNLLVMVLVAWFFSVLLEWLGMALGWWELPGARHAEQLVHTELAWLGRDFATATAGSRPHEWAYRGAAWLYRGSGVGLLLDWVVDPEPARWAALEALRARLLDAGEYLLAAGFITQLIGARLAVVLLSLPVFLLAAVVGLIDGLVQRDLRRFGGGAESSFLYHHLKKVLKPLVWGPVLIYMATPWSLHPSAVFVPPALLFGWLIAKTAARFKKYL